MFLPKIINYLLLLFLFLLPWQTRWIYQTAYLNGNYWEYGALSLYATEILLWLIIILFAIDKFRDKEFWQKITSKEHWRGNKVNLFIGLLVILFLFLPVIASLNWEISYQHFLWVLGGMCVLLVISSLSFRAEKLYLSFWAGGVAQGVLAIWQFFSQRVYASKWLGMAAQDAATPGAGVIELADERWLRAYGSLTGPNPFGMYMAICLVFGLALYVRGAGKRKQEKRPWICIGKACLANVITVGQLLILSGLLLSFSRGAWIAATVGIMSLVGIIFRLSKNCHSERSKPKANEVEESLAVVFPPEAGLSQRLTSLWLAQNPLAERDSSALRPGRIGRNDKMESGATINRMSVLSKHLSYYLLIILYFLTLLHPLFFARFNLQNRLEAKSIQARINQYSEAMAILKKQPWFGVGPGMYTYALYKNNPTLNSWDYQPIHNIYVLMLVEVGMVGLLIYLFIWGWLVRRIWQNNIIFIPIIVTLLVAGLFEHWQWSLFTGVVMWWVVFGLNARK